MLCGSNPSVPNAVVLRASSWQAAGPGRPRRSPSRMVGGESLGRLVYLPERPVGIIMEVSYTLDPGRLRRVLEIGAEVTEPLFLLAGQSSFAGLGVAPGFRDYDAFAARGVASHKIVEVVGKPSVRMGVRSEHLRWGIPSHTLRRRSPIVAIKPKPVHVLIARVPIVQVGRSWHYRTLYIGAPAPFDVLVCTRSREETMYLPPRLDEIGLFYGDVRIILPIGTRTPRELVYV